MNYYENMKVFEVKDSALDYQGWICVDTINNGLAFGGCRFDLSVNKEMVAELAKCMTLKLASHGCPTGGAKGGLCVDPQRPDIEEVIKSFAQNMEPLLTSEVILGKDLGATNSLMNCLYNSISTPQLFLSQKKWPQRNVPNQLSELSGYKNSMTGLGVAWAAKSLFKDDIKGKKVIIQGAGAVGMGAVYRFSELGAKVVGISDVSCCIYQENGFSFGELNSLIRAGKIHTENLSDKVQKLKSDDLFQLSADILVLAATSNSVHAQHAEQIKTPVVVEGSNFGLLPESRKLLFKRNCQVIPDVIASSSSAAMVCHQMASGNSYSSEKLWAMILGSIEKAVNHSYEVAKANNCDMREAYINTLAPAYIRDVTKTAQAA